MNNYDKILNYAKKNNGYITTKETESLEVNSTFLSNLVNDKKLERVGTGIYKLPEYPIDNFYILSKSSKNMCYSHATALYLHNMSDRIPLVYDITVPYNYSGNLLNNENVSLRYVKDDIFELGMIDIKTINDLTFDSSIYTKDSFDDEKLNRLENANDKVTYTLELSLTKDSSDMWKLDALTNEEIKKIQGMY